MVDEFTSGREPILIVEIDQDFCVNTYGVSPCTAAIPTTGTRKCYNTLPTCQDTTHYNPSPLTLRFCQANSDFPKSLWAIPSLVSVSTNPTEINVGGANQNVGPLGRRASVQVVFQDTPYSDKFVDKYRTQRPFDPLTMGTFWSKFLARNLYYQNRSLRVYQGYIGQNLTDMQVRHYVIDTIDGPDSNGQVTVTAKDILKLADDKKAQCPAPSNGTLSADMTNVATTFTLLPAGIGNSEYPSSGIAKMGSEIVTYTRSSDSVTIVRAQHGTAASTHKAGDTFQQVKFYNNVRVDSIIQDLLQNFGNIDSSFIPFTDWQAEASLWLPGFTLTTYITEPTGVTTLVGELLQQCLCYIWWDELEQEIKFRTIRPPLPSDNVKTLTADSNIVSNSLSQSREPSQRISQVWVYYNQVDPTKDVTDTTNYGIIKIAANLALESATEYGESVIQQIFSRWFVTGNAGQVTTLGGRLLAQYGNNPLYVNFSLDAKDRDLKTGDTVRLTHPNIVDDTGAPKQTLLQVISANESQAGHRIDYKCLIYAFDNRYAFVMANGSPVYGLATDAQKLFGAWIAPNATGFADGGKPYLII